MPLQQVPCSAAAAKAVYATLAARPTRQCTAAAAATQQQQQRQWQSQLWPPPGRLLIAYARPVAAAAGDAGDDFEEMLSRRDELLRIKDDLDVGLNTDEEEELAVITDRLLMFGYLEDTDTLDELEVGSDEEEVEEEEEAEEETAMLYSDYDEQEQEEEEEVEEVIDARAGGGAAEAVPRRKGGRGLKVGPDIAIDDILMEAQRGGTAELRNMGMFEATPPGVADGATAAGDEAAVQAKFPEVPQRRYRLAELLRLAGYEKQAASAPDVEVCSILTCNSLAGAEQSLFVCVPSVEGHDGHEWADEASEMGAVAVLAEKALPGALLPVVVVQPLQEALGRLADVFYERPSRRLRAIGLVGSYGKTTAAWLARGMFEEMGERCGMLGTIEYALEEVRLTEEGDVWVAEEEDVTLQRNCSSPFHITPYEGKYPQVPTTPDALHIQKALAGCADRGASVALLELDPASLGDGRADQLYLDALVYTNSFVEKEAGAEGGAEACAASVQALFRRLTDLERQRAVVNIDDALGAELAQQVLAAGATVLTYSYGNRGADIYAEKVKNSIWETEVLVNTPLGRLQIITPLLGRTNVNNVLAAVGTGIVCGVPLKAIVAGIEAVDIIPGRCEIIDEGQPFSVVVDSASTPAQLSRLLDDVKEAGAKRVLLVFGCPGNTGPEERAAMTEMAHYKADVVYITNDSPGIVWPHDIVDDMVAGLPEEITNRYPHAAFPYLQDPHRVPQWYQKYLLQYQSVVGVYIIEDRFQAIRVAIGMAKACDVVVVVGKGHRDWQEYWDGADMVEPETLKSWFDDRVECRNALSKLPYLTGIKDLNRDFLPWTRYAEEERDILVMEGIQEGPVGDVL